MEDSKERVKIQHTFNQNEKRKNVWQYWKRKRKKFPKPIENSKLQIQSEVQQIPSRMHKRKLIPAPVIVKLQKRKDKILKALGDKKTGYLQRISGWTDS